MIKILLSIKPKWCEAILSGRKTIEVRKTAPKIKTPFKVFIYCTKGTFDITACPDLNADSVKKVSEGRGKIIGEFFCDDIKIYKPFFYNGALMPTGEAHGSCLSEADIKKYSGGGTKPLYLWYISNPKTYDKPRELSDFNNYVNDKCIYKEVRYTIDGKRYFVCTRDTSGVRCENKPSWWGKRDCIGYVPNKISKPLERPPQSWRYIEEQE